MWCGGFSGLTQASLGSRPSRSHCSGVLGLHMGWLSVNAQGSVRNQERTRPSPSLGWRRLSPQHCGQPQDHPSVLHGNAPPFADGPWARSLLSPLKKALSFLTGPPSPQLDQGLLERQAMRTSNIKCVRTPASPFLLFLGRTRDLAHVGSAVPPSCIPPFPTSVVVVVVCIFFLLCCFVAGSQIVEGFRPATE